jgi:hypothetical protein
MVDKNVDRHKTRTIAEGYLNFLYSPLAQDLIGKNHYRPRNAKAAAKYAGKFKQHPAGDHRRHLRRLEEGPGHALRRRRPVRQDLQASRRWRRCSTPRWACCWPGP